MNQDDDIINGIINLMPIIKHQLMTLFESIEKFKYKRHLIIYSYLLGYFVSKKILSFDQNKIQTTIEIFNQSINQKQDFSKFIVSIALSLNYYNELEQKKK